MTQILVLLHLILLAMPVFANSDISWSFETKARVVAVGDLHGDLAALKQILLQNRVIDNQGKWISGADHLVLTGDLVNMGNQSFALVNYVMNLEKEAMAAGGKVHVLIGNHEIMLATGKFNLLSPEDKKAFAESVAPGEAYSSENLFSAFTGNSIYAKWLRGLNSIVRINRGTYVHAGLDRWIFDFQPGQINSLIRAWLYQSQMTLSPVPTGPMPRPPAMETKFLIQPGSGPSGTSAMNDTKNEKGRIRETLSLNEVKQILDHLNSDFIAVGHMQTHDQRISLNHSQYGRWIIQLDTGISEAEGSEKGRLSALIVEGERIQSWHSDRKLISSGGSCRKTVQSQ